MNSRYKLLIKAKSSKDPADWTLYKAYRNKVTALFRKAETVIWKNELETAQGKDIQCFWNIVRRLTSKEKTSNVSGRILDDNDVLEYEDKEKANIVHILSSNFGSKLAKAYHRQMQIITVLLTK